MNEKNTRSNDVGNKNNERRTLIPYVKDLSHKIKKVLKPNEIEFVH